MGRKHKLTDEQCMEIREKILEDLDVFLLARLYRVSTTTIQNANLRARARELGMSWDDMLKWKKNYFAKNSKGEPVL